MCGEGEIVLYFLTGTISDLANVNDACCARFENRVTSVSCVLVVSE